MQNYLGERIRKIREAKNLSRDQVAAKCNLTPGHIGRIERNNSNNPRFETINKIASALDVSATEILHPPQSQEEIEDSVTPNPISHEVPVIGLTKAGRNGFFDDTGLPKAEGFRKVQRAVDIKDPHAYALRVEGDSMSPMLESGCVVYASPNDAYGPGDLVVVALASNDVIIQKLCQQNGMVILQSVNPSHPPLVLNNDDFRFIHKVCLIKPK